MTLFDGNQLPTPKTEPPPINPSPPFHYPARLDAHRSLLRGSRPPKPAQRPTCYPTPPRTPLACRIAVSDPRPRQKTYLLLCALSFPFAVQTHYIRSRSQLAGIRNPARH